MKTNIGPRTLSAARIQSNNCKNEKSSNKRVFLILMLIGLAGLATIDVSNAAGDQTYDVIPLHPAFKDPATIKRMDLAAKRYAYETDLAKFTDKRYAQVFYGRYLPARITQPSASSEINQLMMPIRKRLDRAVRTGAPGHNDMLVWLLSGLRPIAEGNYRPAARINAILLISHMDIEPADRAAKTPPVPHSSIPDILLPIYQDKSAGDGVRAMALKGIRRYVKFAGAKLSQDMQRELVAEMGQLLQQDAPIDRQPAAHAYLRRFAVDVLASLSTQMNGLNSLGAELVRISTDPSEHDLIAIHSAAKLANVPVNLKGNPTAVEQVLAGWALRAVSVFDMEIARLKRLDRPRPVAVQPSAPETTIATLKATSRSGQRSDLGRGGDPGSGQQDDDAAYDEIQGEESMAQSMGGGRFGVSSSSSVGMQPPEVTVSRRKLNHLLQQLQLGATGATVKERSRTSTVTNGGLAKSAPASKRPMVAEWTDAVERVATKINSYKLSNRSKYLSVLAEQSASLKRLAKSLKSGAERPFEAAPKLGAPGQGAPFASSD